MSDNWKRMTNVTSLFIVIDVNHFQFKPLGIIIPSEFFCLPDYTKIFTHVRCFQKAFIECCTQENRRRCINKHSISFFIYILHESSILQLYLTRLNLDINLIYNYFFNRKRWLSVNKLFFNVRESKPWLIFNSLIFMYNFTNSYRNDNDLGYWQMINELRFIYFKYSNCKTIGNEKYF